LKGGSYNVQPKRRETIRIMLTIILLMY